MIDATELLCAFVASSLRSRYIGEMAASGRWPMPPRWQTPSPAPRPLMMVCVDGVRPGPGRRSAHAGRWTDRAKRRVRHAWPRHHANRGDQRL